MFQMIDFAAAPTDLYLGIFVALACTIALLAMQRRVARTRAREPLEATGPSHEANLSFEGLFFVERGVIADVNVALCSMLGRARDEIVGAKLASFFTAESQPDLQRVVTDRTCTIDVELVTADGGQRDVDVAMRVPASGPGEVSVVAVRDITERKQAERKNQQIILTDPMTGVGNRPLFHERLRQAIEWARRTDTSVAVVSIDIDRLKTVNSRMGHNIGHGLLIEVADRLCDGTRQIDTVARMEDDQFAVIATLIRRPEDVLTVAGRLLETLNRPYNIEGYLPDVRVSLGIAMYPADATRPDSVLKLSNLALVRAKHDGGNQLRFFCETMDTKLHARGTLEQDLRTALARREIEVCHQGIFDAASHELRGYAALPRWRHPSRGVIPAAEVIALAQDCGLVSALGDQVLETACAEAAGWTDPLVVSVSLPVAVFSGTDLPERVLAILARTGLAPERLELAVTETALIDDTDRVLATLNALRRCGVRIALDEFGVGYASLGYLRRFDFDTLRIDRSVIADLGADPDAATTVRAFVALARTLELEVVATGVDCREHVALLAELGCDKVQGTQLVGPAPTGERAPRALARLEAA